MTILLDGGMGQELRARGLNTDAKVAGLALIESPAAVRDVHQEFIEAGAEVITTWNYAVTPYRLAQSGLRDRLGQMTRMAVEMANEARTRGAKSGVRVAGSLPPLRASYEPNAQDPVSMGEEYAEIAGHLIDRDPLQGDGFEGAGLGFEGDTGLESTEGQAGDRAVVSAQEQPVALAGSRLDHRFAAGNQAHIVGGPFQREPLGGVFGVRAVGHLDERTGGGFRERPRDGLAGLYHLTDPAAATRLVKGEGKAGLIKVHERGRDGGGTGSDDRLIGSVGPTGGRGLAGQSDDGVQEHLVPIPVCDGACPVSDRTRTCPT